MCAGLRGLAPAGLHPAPELLSAWQLQWKRGRERKKKGFLIASLGLRDSAEDSQCAPVDVEPALGDVAKDSARDVEPRSQFAFGCLNSEAVNLKICSAVLQ